MDPAHAQAVTWYTRVLPRNTQQALIFLSKKQWLKKSSWYLAGGTALALQEGHRQSLDLDFFSVETTFMPFEVVRHFQGKDFHVDIAREGTLYGRLLNAKISFIAYPFFVPKQKPNLFGVIKVLRPADIAVMKIIAISQRGRKRDFVDLYWYCTHHETLAKIMSRLPAQYPTVAHNYHHIIKSLTYFDDAEDDPVPKLFFRVTWGQIKRYFQNEVTKVSREYLGL